MECSTHACVAPPTSRPAVPYKWWEYHPRSPFVLVALKAEPTRWKSFPKFPFIIAEGKSGANMLSKKFTVVVALVIAVICLAEANDGSPHDMADALRMLQELDRYYTQVARPRIDRRDVADGDRVDPDILDRALRLLQLQTLDRIYSYHTRPRFGKRSDAIANWAKDLEKPDLPAWLTYARRR